jgi:acyl-CoA thioester hydrolase
MTYEQIFTTKWADFDPNRHMRHTAYNDYAAEIRVRFFSEHGFSLNEFAKLHIGPILFKEETSFFKEIHIGEDIKVNMTLDGASKNLERWRFTHHIYNHKNELAAEVKVYGAWIDLSQRKLTKPPKAFITIFSELSKTASFVEIPLKNEK